jgi:hypothetical protein
MSEKSRTITERQWKKERKADGMRITRNPSIPKDTQPYEDWELRLIARDNNSVIQRSTQCDRFMATIRALKCRRT